MAVLLLVLPAGGLAQPGGLVVDAKGLVEVARHASDLWASADPAMRLFSGDTVRTGADGWAAILMADETLLQLNRHTTFLLKQAASTAEWLKLRGIVSVAASAAAASLYRLDAGEVWLRNHHPDVRMAVETPTISAGIRGTEVNIQIAPDETVTLSVLGGSVKVSSAYGTIEAGPLEQIVAPKGVRPRKQPLLSPGDVVQWTQTIPFLSAYLDPPLTGTDRAALTNEAKRLEALVERQPAARIQLDTMQGLVDLIDRDALRAAQRLHRTVTAHPEAAVAWRLLALAELLRADTLTASDCAQKAVALTPRSPAALVVKGIVHQARWELGEARTALEQALSHDEQNLPAALIQSGLLLQGCRRAQAFGALRGLRRVAPQRSEVDNLQGFLLLTAGKPKDAMTAFRRALARDPGLGEAHLGLALGAMRRSEMATAVESGAKALLLEPRRPFFLTCWAKVLHRIGRARRARQVLVYAHRLDPLDPIPMLLHADLQEGPLRPAALADKLARLRSLSVTCGGEGEEGVGADQLLRRIQGRGLWNSYAYLKALWDSAQRREAQLTDIRAEEEQAYRHRFGSALPLASDPRWRGTESYEGFRRRERSVDHWFSDTSREATERYLQGAAFPNGNAADNEEPARQCLFACLVAHRLQLLTGTATEAAVRLDADGDGIPDDRDACPGTDDRLDADGDGSPDCLARADCGRNAHWDAAAGGCTCDGGYELCRGRCRPACGRYQSRADDCRCRYDPNAELAQRVPGACKTDVDCPQNRFCSADHRCLPRAAVHSGGLVAQKIRDEEGKKQQVPDGGAAGGGDPMDTGDYGMPPKKSESPSTSPGGSQGSGRGGLTDVTVDVNPCRLQVWDHSREDLDRVTITLNGKTVANNLTLRKAVKTIALRLDPGANQLAVRALNIGDPALQKRWKLDPYNSAALSISGVVEGRRQQQWRLRAGETASMTVTYRP
jgi:tetratricopeptide (TPR) repeat protein